jgi:hypothetical protein
MPSLTATQVLDWQRDGFLAPFSLLTETELRNCLQGLQRFEDWLGGSVNGNAELKWRTMPYLLMPLRPGEFSMHHGLSPHRSGPNTSHHRRIGLGLNYIPSSVHSTGSAKPAAMLVRGTDRGGHFELLAPPAGEFVDTAIAAHEHAVAVYRANYVEQEARHAKWAATS